MNRKRINYMYELSTEDRFKGLAGERSYYQSQTLFAKLFDGRTPDLEWQNYRRSVEEAAIAAFILGYEYVAKSNPPVTTIEDILAPHFRSAPEPEPEEMTLEMNGKKYKLVEEK